MTSSNITRVTPEMVDNAIASINCFSAAEGVAGHKFVEEYALTNDDNDLVENTTVVHAECDIPLNILTICVIVLKNGWTVLGTSAPVDALAFNSALGEKYAIEDAKEKIWPYLGYQLCVESNK